MGFAYWKQINLNMYSKCKALKKCRSYFSGSEIFSLCVYVLRGGGVMHAHIWGVGGHISNAAWPSCLIQRIWRRRLQHLVFSCHER